MRVVSLYLTDLLGSPLNKHLRPMDFLRRRLNSAEVFLDSAVILNGRCSLGKGICQLPFSYGELVGRMFLSKRLDPPTGFFGAGKQFINRFAEVSHLSCLCFFCEFGCFFSMVSCV